MAENLEIGQEFEVSVIAYTESGEGISSKNGILLIIPGANIGPKVMVKVMEMGVTRAYCKLIDYLWGGG